jgi:trans-aconitate methyltransferase
MTVPAFDSHASDYEAECMRGLSVSGESKEFFARGRLAHLVGFIERTGRPRPGRIVDFGCGIGDVSALLAETFPLGSVLGVDSSSRCVERAAQAHAGGRVAFATTDALDGAQRAPVDLVHVNGVVHHVPPADRPLLMATLRQWVRPGGLLALFENNPLNPGTRIVMARIPFDHDAQPITAGRTRQLLQEAGFRILETGYLFYFPHLLRALRPLEPFLTGVPLGAQYGIIATPV